MDSRGFIEFEMYNFIVDLREYEEENNVIISIIERVPN